MIATDWIVLGIPVLLFAVALGLLWWLTGNVKDE